jgi:glycogen operon protein
LGATWDGLGTNFAVFSAHAERIELCLFDPTGRREIARLDLPECTDEIWHGYLPNGRLGQIYGFRAHGPYRPHDGHRFNPQLLLDPTRGDLSARCGGPTLCSDTASTHRVPISRSIAATAPGVPKTVVSEYV